MGTVPRARRVKTRDMTGHRFGRLVVVARAPTLRYSRWHCLCDCGGTAIVSLQLLSMGAKGTRSCGCLKREANRRNCWSPRANVVRWRKDDGGATLAAVWQ